MKIKASYHQERLWFIHQFECGELYPSGSVYHNVPLVLEIDGELDIDLVKQGLQFVINRHEALHTRMITVEGELFQQIEPKLELELQVLDLNAGTGETGAEFPLEAAIDECKRPFRVEGEPLIRAALINIPTDKHLLVITLHHLVSDRYSLGIIASEFVCCYQALKKGKYPHLPEVSLHYADFSQWQRHLPRKYLEEIFLYWKRQLSGISPLELPANNRRAAIHTFREARTYIQFPEMLSAKIREFSHHSGKSMKTIMMAAFNILLHRYCHQEDIVIGTSTDNRHQPETRTMVGPAANLLVIRTSISREETFNRYLFYLSETLEQAYENRDIPFDRLALELNPQKDMSRTVFFDVVFAYREDPLRITAGNNLKIKYIETNLGWGKYDLNLLVQGGDNSLSGIMVYNNDYYDASFISNFVDHYQTLLIHILQEPDQPAAHVEILTARQRYRLLHHWNRTRARYPTDKLLHRLFEDKVEKTLDHTALVGWQPGARKQRNKEGKKEDISITYKKLNQKSDQLAGLLIKKGVGADTIVGIMVERSLELIIGILGILKAGGAYLPIDPDYPDHRKQYMLNDSGANLTVTCKSFNFSSYHSSSFHPCWEPSPATSLAYIIYTSGTTGRPKGCGVTHKNVVRLLKNDRLPFEFGDKDTWLMAHSFCFDFSVWEMYGALLYGGKLIVPHRQHASDINRVHFMLRQHRVTVLNQTPQSFYALVEVELNCPVHSLNRHLRYIIFGGDKLLPRNLATWIGWYSPAEIQLVNMYGITETTVHVTHYRLQESDIDSTAGISPIGHPLPETALYILDNYLNPVPTGVTGELFVGGTGVARGYLNQPELTAGRFLRTGKLRNWNAGKKGKDNDPTPTGITNTNILYKTGDMGRRLWNGGVEYLGRNDDQLQVRGYRIEPAEIEILLLKHPAIRDVVVMTFENTGIQTSLCAYIRLNPGQDPLPPVEMRKYLSGTLPDYMIPTFFIPVKTIPLTSNGKVDKKALPSPGIKKDRAGSILPRNPREETLAVIWSEVLGTKKKTIGIDDDFFELGGHSLKATVMVSRIHKELKVRIPLSEVFKTPTIRELSKYISRLTRDEYVSIKPLEKKEYYHLSSSQKRLYLLQQMEPDSTAYNMPEFIPLDREPGKEKLKRVFNRLIQRHESLRTSFHMIDDQPVQKVHDEVVVEVEVKVEEEGESFGRISNACGEDLATEDTDNTEEKNYKLQNTMPLSIKKAGAKTNTNHKLQITNKKETGSHHSSFIIHHSFVRPFALSRLPLLRVGLIKTTESDCLLMVDMHHIISDGISHEILVRDFMTLYRGEELPTLRIQYKDFARWQNNKIQRESIKEQQNYWLKEFAGEIPVLDLPTDYVRPAVKGFEGKSLEFEISPENTGSLETMAASQGVTLYMVLLAIMNILLAKLNSQEDIIIGSPIAGRPHADLEKIIGMFVNTLALRNYPGGEMTFNRFLKDVKHRTLKAFENQGYPFEELVENVNVNRDTSRNPLFDVMFVLQTSIGQDPGPGNPRQDLPGIRPGTTPGYQYEDHSAKFDLTAAGVKAKDRLLFSFNYNTQLFKKETIEQFINYYKRIITSVVEEPGMKLWQIEIITREEKQQVLYGFNDTNVEYPGDKTIYRLFEEQMKRTPDNTALVGSKLQTTNYKLQTNSKLQNTNYKQNGGMHLTYKELNRLANQLAHLLIEKGVKSDTVVGIMVERSLEMIIGILGILKAGGAYLPIDPDYPQERINYMLEDSAASILLTQQDIAAAVFSSATLTSTSTCQVSPANLAYIIYTSGSTGRPKGVLIQHCSLVNRLNWMQKTYPLDTNDTLLQKTTYTFDVSVWEILWWSFTGAKLCLLKPGGEKDPAVITETIEKNRVTVIHFVPSMLNVFLEYLQASGQAQRLSCLKQVIVSGEALTVSHVNRFNEIFPENNTAKPKLDNLYGPTEATIDVSYFTCPQEKIEKIPIGKPIDNIQLYVMDQWFQLQPVGISGELCIAGHGLARGYLNRPELTAEKFCLGPGGRFLKKLPPWTPRKNFLLLSSHSPHSPYSTIYKTGDSARWLSDGNIEFLGRVDSQVKIRGSRVELGEIENQLNRHKAVKESVVMHRETRDSDQYLCAYIVPVTDSAPDQSFALEQELKEYLSSSLPGYMIPGFFVHLERIPLTPNGKIDRKQLPEPDITPGENYIAPANVLEKTLVDLWSEVLDVEKDRISVNASFFQLGGHSLKASILTAGIYKKLEVNLPLLEIFRNPTVRKMAGILQKAEKTTFIDMEKEEKKEYYPLSFNQKRIFVLHQLVPEGTAYNLPGTFVINHELKEKVMKDILHQIINRHESLRTGFKIVNDEPVQFIIDLIAEEFDLPFTFTDLSALRENEKQEERDRVYLSLATSPFDLARAPLFRSLLLKYHTGHYEFMYNMHHIITDGWSMEILRHEFAVLYEAHRGGNDFEPEPLTLQYKDFTAWHNKQLKGQEGGKSQEFWKKKLEKGIPSFQIPGNFAGKANDYKGAVYSCVLHQEIKEQIKKLAELHHTSVFMVLFTLYLLLLSRFSHQKEIACSIIDAGREHPSLHNIIGFFVNAVIFNTGIDDQENFSDFLHRVHPEVMILFQHQWYPLEQVCEDLKIPYPDVPISFNMLNQQDASQDLEFSPAGLFEHIDSQDVKFELEPYITEYKNGILMHWVYKKNLFRPIFIEYIVEEYIKVVDFFTRNPHKCFKDYRNLGRKAISLKKTYTAEKSEYIDSNIVREFENQVRKSPDSVAVKSGEETFTYGELNRYANPIARQIEQVLRQPSHDGKPDTREAKNINKIIGLLLEPGFDMVAGIIGTLKTGSAYVPLSPDYPEKRLSYILTHSEACILISTGENKPLAKKLASENRIPFLDLSGIPFNIQDHIADQNPVRHIPGSSLAYLLYTSGSTGTPKGVMQNHQNILYFIKNWTRRFSLSGSDRLTLLSSFCHDASIPDIFGALLSGAALYPFDIKNRENSMDLAQFLVKERITHWHSVASLFGYFANSLEPGNKFPALRYVILGGEAVREHDIHRCRDFFPGSVLAAVYGQTESTVNALWFVRQPASLETGSFNRPLLGETLEETRIFVVDEEGRQVQAYETGEIVVASPYISMGYWKDDASTQKSFKREPNIGKLYYTGDLGRFLPDGSIEFMGRKDWQVKIRGYRIEPGEIESQLLKYPDIKEAVVTARENQTGQTADRYLCAHVVSGKDLTSAPTQTELREYLSGQLPGYMIPGVFLQLEKMPLTATGKLDRKALPEPRLNGETGSVAPGTYIEQKVAQTWKEVLKLEQVGIMDSFFSIGGNSVNILQVNIRLRREFNREIPLVKMFEYPTIQALSRYLAQLCAPGVVDEPYAKYGNTGVQEADVEEERHHMLPQQPLQRLEQTLAIIKGK